MQIDGKILYKSLVSLCVEKALLDIGKPTYEKVVEMLYKEYHCYLPECYEHPEYLHNVLTKIFGEGGKVIVQSIKSKLEEFEKYGLVHEFLEVISK